MPSVASLRRMMAETCRRLDELRFVPGSAGNVSVRVGRDAMLITPSGSALGRLKHRDFLRVRLDGSRASRGRPSAEAAVHALVYRARPDVGAVIHAHPPALVGFAMARKDFGKPSNMEVYALLGKPVLVPFAPVGESGPALEPVLAEGDCFILANHGPLVLGGTLAEALHRIEVAECAARAFVAARALGGPVRFTQAELKRIRQFMSRVGLPLPRSIAGRRQRTRKGIR